MAIWTAGIFIFFLMASSFVGWKLSAPVYKGQKTKNFNGREFVNPGGIKAKTFSDLVKWMLNREKGSWSDSVIVSEGPPPEKFLADGHWRITFINHSTALIQVGGINLLIDPIWSKRASPFQFIGPKRVRTPGIRFEDLPHIDLVLISHNHYDHLDVSTIRKLQEVYQPLFIVPLGVGRFLEKKGISNFKELDWEQSEMFAESLKITAAPAIHFSGRGFYDRNATLWCGFIIQNGADKIYYAGDTGYGGIFREIGLKYGPFKASLIPIGAYRPEWFMEPIHVSPVGAIKIHRDVRSQKSIALHHGTFPLADEGLGEAIEDLEKAKIEFGLEKDEFVVLSEGSHIDL